MLRGLRPRFYLTRSQLSWGVRRLQTSVAMTNRRMSTIRWTDRGLSIPACLILLCSSANAAAQIVSGVRFSVDTSAALVSMLGARVEFAAGRGRIDVSTVASRPARSVNGVTIGPPIARAGDYYLFDSTGYVVVRPSSRTFSVMSRTAAT